MDGRPSSSYSMPPVRHSRSETNYSISTADSNHPLLPPESPQKFNVRAKTPESTHRTRYSPQPVYSASGRPVIWRNATVLTSTIALIWTTYSTIRYFVAVHVFALDPLRRRINLILAIIHALCLLALLLYLFICIWMKRSSLTLHLTSLLASLALLLSSISNLVFTDLWHHPTGLSSSPLRSTTGRCDFAFDVFWTGTGGSCTPGISWGYLLAGALIRVFLTGVILMFMHLALRKWTDSEYVQPSSRGAYTNVKTNPVSTGTSMMENRRGKKNSRLPPPLNLSAPESHHHRNKSGDSSISMDSTTSNEHSPKPTAEQLRAWAAQYHSRIQPPEEEVGDEEVTIQFATCDSPSPQTTEFGSPSNILENSGIRLGRIPGIVHRLSTIESLSEGGVSRSSTMGRVTPSASIHLSINNGWANEFGVTREGSHGTNASGSSVGGVRRMDSFVSAFSVLSPATSPSHPQFPERVATSDSIGSSSTRTEYFNALDADGSDPWS